MNGIKCKLCNGETVSKVDLNQYEIYKCKRCGLEFLMPFPTLKGVEKMYEKGYFEGEMDGVGGYENYSDMADWLKKEALRRINYMLGFEIGKKWLDVGAGVGDFLDIARDKGYLVYGNDVSNFCLNEMKEKKIETISGPISTKTFPIRKFDAVTAWDVVEHLPNILEATKAISRSLVKGGYFFLTTPNTESWDARLMKSRWYGYRKVPEHILYFNTDSITRLLNQSGMKVVEIKQWGFERSVAFVFERYIGKIPESIKKKFNLSFFLPMIDFIVVAKKI